MNWLERKKYIKSLNQTDFDEISLVITLVSRRKQLGMSQEELAKITGLHQSAISRMEKEGVVPKVDTLDRVARALGLKLTLVKEEDLAGV